MTRRSPYARTARRCMCTHMHATTRGVCMEAGCTCRSWRPDWNDTAEVIRRRILDLLAAVDACPHAAHDIKAGRVKW